jgi:hypothetical protein
MWRLLKINSPEWKVLSLGFFCHMTTGAIMPLFAVFYGEMFKVSYTARNHRILHMPNE